MKIKFFNQKMFKKILLFLPFILMIANASAQSCPSQTTYGDTWATLVGEIQDNGGDPNITAWFEWGTSSFSLTNRTPDQSLYVPNPPQRFCQTITGLQPCTTYFYRAASRNSGGTNYGNIYSFITNCTFSNLQVSCSASPNPANIGQTVVFTANVSGGTGSYSYSWSGACFGFSSTCSRSFSSAGTYTATVTVTSGSQTQSASCSVNVSSGSSFPITINPFQINQPPVPIIAFTPEEIRPGTIVTFDASNSYDPDGTIIAYEWRINNEITSYNRQFSRALASGTYRIKLTVTDNQGASNSKEILISVGRNVFITRTQTIVRNVPSAVQVTSQAKLVDLLLDASYLVFACQKNEIQITLINNTNVNRKVVLRPVGETASWFNPQSKTLILKSRSTNLIKWEVNPPCGVKAGNYDFNLQVETPGGFYNFSSLFEVKEKTNPFSPLLGFIGGILFNWWLLLLFILIILLNAYLWYRNLKKQEQVSKA